METFVSLVRDKWKTEVTLIRHNYISHLNYFCRTNFHYFHKLAHRSPVRTMSFSCSVFNFEVIRLSSAPRQGADLAAARVETSKRAILHLTPSCSEPRRVSPSHPFDPRRAAPRRSALICTFSRASYDEFDWVIPARRGAPRRGTRNDAMGHGLWFLIRVLLSAISSRAWYGARRGGAGRGETNERESEWENYRLLCVSSSPASPPCNSPGFSRYARAWRSVTRLARVGSSASILLPFRYDFALLSLSLSPLLFPSLCRTRVTKPSPVAVEIDRRRRRDLSGKWQEGENAWVAAGRDGREEADREKRGEEGESAR